MSKPAKRPSNDVVPRRPHHLMPLGMDAGAVHFITSCNNDGNTFLNECLCQRRQTLVLILSPGILNNNVAAVGIPNLDKTVLERTNEIRITLWRCAIQKSDDRLRRGLRGGVAGPRTSRKACRSTDKIPPLRTDSRVLVRALPIGAIQGGSAAV